VVTEERTNEVRSLLATLRRWAQGKSEIVAVGLVGSWVRNARMDSDVDVGLLTEERAPYPEDDAWVREVGGVEFVWTRQWGSVLYAPKRFLAGLLDACGRSQATENSVGLGVGHA
jgi:predicted nucleotidyltransferase